MTGTDCGVVPEDKLQKLMALSFLIACGPRVVRLFQFRSLVREGMTCVLSSVLHGHVQKVQRLTFHQFPFNLWSLSFPYHRRNGYEEGISKEGTGSPGGTETADPEATGRRVPGREGKRL